MKVLIAFISFFIIVCSYAQQSNKMQAQLEKLVSDKDLKSASVGFYAINLKTSEVIAKHNEQKSLVPASTMKVLTTAAALKTFGKNYRFKTELQYDGFIDTVNCVLHGNIYIKGGGDPTLGSALYSSDNPLRFLNYWADAVFNQLGIDSIVGDIFPDATLFDNSVPSGWAWGDIGNYYGAGANALSVCDNIYELEFDTRSGQKAEMLNVWPCVPGLEIINEVEASSLVSGDNTNIYGSPYHFERVIKGSIPAGRRSFKVKGSLPAPDKLAAWLLKEELKQYGFSFRDSSSSILQLNIKERTSFYQMESPLLEEIIYQTNLKSINPYAEHLLNHLGVKKYGMGSTAKGADAMTEFWKNQKVDTDGMFIADGSGLARSNGISALHLVQVLENVNKDKQNAEAFKRSLPIAGKSGSIANMCKGTLAEGNLMAKSGYMTRVRSYAGYVKNTKGDLIAFAIIVNNYNCSAAEMKSKIEKLFVQLVESE
jgi:serine-type D-Ala-D-Ala carboxypeptidase/endopeptidase (penicillin-binding protein 4)